VESTLIEVMNMKMLSIELVSSMNLIQIQSTEAAYVLSQRQTRQLADASFKR
jgi:hypothetical protein